MDALSDSEEEKPRGRIVKLRNSYQEREKDEAENEEVKKRQKERQLEEEEDQKQSRPRRNPRCTTIQMDGHKRTLAADWKANRVAGRKDASIDLTSSTSYGCSARAYVKRRRNPIQTNFHSDECHAEMNLLVEIYQQVKSLNTITSIEIEKEPCARCAVVLNKLGLADKVTYKGPTLKDDYPTWRFPDLTTVVWSNKMGVDSLVQHEDDVEELLNYFRTRKWW